MHRVEKVEPILEMIRKHESDRAVEIQGVPTAYDVVYGGIPPKWRTKRNLTTYPIAEVLEWQGFVIAQGVKSSAAGAYQIIRKTMVSLKMERTRRFDAECQDEAALILLDRRGWAKCEAGKMTPESFADQLAREWASLPVQKAQQGANQWVRRGQSYYAGDGLNKAHATPEEVMLAIGRSLASLPPPLGPLSLEDRVAAIEKELEEIKAILNSAQKAG